LIALAQSHRDWTLGFADEVWWSRLARPALRSWREAGPARLVQQTLATDDPEPKALASYGLLVRPAAAEEAMPEDLWLRFVDGQPVSALTTQFLTWCCQRLAEVGQTTLLLVWDNASWHVSAEVRRWLRTHNQHVHRAGGVRIVPCWLPTKSPWLNPIEPKWVHAKRRIVEPARVLTARELEHRVCAALRAPLADHLTLSQEVR
jgi:transposase